MPPSPCAVALLFGRGGSVALPGKNVRKILGRPSLHYPLMAARDSGVVQTTYLSTDSPEILDLAKPFGVREIRRPAELAADHALLEDAIAHAFGVAERDFKTKVDFYLILLCNAVTVLPDRIRQAYEILRQETRADSVTTASQWNMFSPVRARRADKKSGVLSSFVPLDLLSRVVPISCDRDQSEDCYFCDNSFTLVRREALLHLKEQPGPFRWMGNRIRFIEQLPGGGDIDMTWQVPAAEWWLREHGFTEKKVPWEALHDSA